MLRKYVGDKKSIEARSDDGKIWVGELFESGQLTKFSEATLQEVEDLAREKGMRLVPNRR